MGSRASGNHLALDATHRTVVLALIVIPTALLVLGVGFGVLQVLYRAGLIQHTTFLGFEYYQGLTLHGVVNALVYTTFFEVAFGYAVVAYYLRCTFNAAVTWIAFALMLGGTLLAAFAMLNGTASVLYTFYPPLKASPLFYIGAALLVIGSWLPFFQWLVAYHSWCGANRQSKTPLAVVGILATFIVWMFATLPLAFEVVVQLIPWSLGLTATVNVVLARTLFWFFGHPLVYFWLLPSYVMFYVMLPPLVGGKLYSDAAARLAFLLFVVFSAPVGLHHQFADPGISASYKWMHAFLTFMVALPSFMTAFTVAASLESGARARGGRGLFGWWRALPYFDRDRYLFAYCFAGLALFVFGGITGIINASAGMNNLVHNTAWIPGHFHTTLGGPTFLSFIAMSLLLLTQLTGKPLRWPGLNILVPYLWLGGVLIFSVGLSVAGLIGAPRRANLGPSYADPSSPLFMPDWQIWDHIGALGGVIMGIAMLCYFLVFFGTLFSRAQAPATLVFPTAEAYHDEPAPLLQRFTPWVVAAIILLFVAYVPPLYEIVTGPTQAVPGYAPSRPVVAP